MNNKKNIQISKESKTNESLLNTQNNIEKKDKWLRNIKENWRNVQCICGSSFHFDGDIDSFLNGKIFICDILLPILTIIQSSLFILQI
jgi:hypothetical protein